MTVPANPATPISEGTAVQSRPDAGTIASSVARLLDENPQYRAGIASTDASVTGTTVHAVVAILAPVSEQFTPAGLIEVTLGLSRALSAPGRLHRRTSMMVAGFAAEYLRGVARPRSPWACIDTEAETDSGIVDLVWAHNETGSVFIDELKTTEAPRARLDLPWVKQARRYTIAGAAAWGNQFVGVRLIPLGSMHLTTVVLPDGALRPFVPTVQDPLGGVA